MLGPASDDRVLTVAVLSLYGLSLAVLAMDLPYILGMEVVVTVGRVSVIGPDIYLFTGSLVVDQAVFWLLVAASSILLAFTTRRFIYRIPLLAVSITGLISPIVLRSDSLYVILASISIAVVLVVVVLNHYLRELVQGVLLALAVVESIKVAYLLSRLATGAYLGPSTPVYFNAIASYYLWPLITAVLALIPLYSGLKALFRLLGPRVLSRLRLHGSPVNAPAASSGGWRRDAVYLFTGIALSVAMGLIPYAPTLNPQRRPVNVDWVFYYSYLNSMIKGDFNVLVTQSSRVLPLSDRPLYLLLLYVAWYVTRLDPRTIAVYHNIVLLPLYTTSLYLLAKRWRGSRVAGYVALTAPFSPLFLSFIYGGFQADLLAVSLLYVSIYLLMGPGKRSVVSGLLLFTTVMFTHEWTFTQYALILAGYVFLRLTGRLLKYWRLGFRDKAIILYMATGLAFELARGSMLKAFNISSVVETALRMVDYRRVNPFTLDARFYTTIYTGGSLDDPVFYIIASTGLGALAMDLPSLAIVASTTLALLPWSLITYRVLINAPLQLLAGYSIAKRSKWVRIALVISMAGFGLWRLYSITPGLSLTP